MRTCLSTTSGSGSGAGSTSPSKDHEPEREANNGKIPLLIADFNGGATCECVNWTDCRNYVARTLDTKATTECGLRTKHMIIIVVLYLESLSESIGFLC